MHSALEQLQDSGIPTRSAVAAIQYLGARENLTPDQYTRALSNLVDMPVLINDDKLVRYVYLYTVQGLINKSLTTDNIDVTEVFSVATTNAKNYIAKNPWVLAEAEEVVRTDAAGKPKRKKGAKQEAAAVIYKENKDTLDRKQIIELFIEELDMSKSGATTYFYNMRKKFGE